MPDPVLLMIGDLHAGSSAAVMAPFQDHDGVKYSPSRVQSALLKFWRQVLDEVKDHAKGHDLILCLGGDMVDGVGHHGTTQTVGDQHDQVDLAAQLLLPFANMSKRMYALLGTDAHVGPSGQDDISVARELGAKAAYRWRLDYGGKLLDWAHHSGLGRLPWTRESVLTRLGNKILIECLERGQRRPDIVVRHHVHAYARVHVKGTDVVTVPGWQAATSWTRRIDPASLLTVGVVLWYPVSGEILPVLRSFPDDPIEYAYQPKRSSR